MLFISITTTVSEYNGEACYYRKIINDGVVWCGPMWSDITVTTMVLIISLKLHALKCFISFILQQFTNNDIFFVNKEWRCTFYLCMFTLGVVECLRNKLSSVITYVLAAIWQPSFPHQSLFFFLLKLIREERGKKPKPKKNTQLVMLPETKKISNPPSISNHWHWRLHP